ncbi:MAG TPA: endonuclease [Candidatus Kerfeldbacteria bacterium]|nr:endonuclease [Candidatus Kerfeldbacteria bacterium]
MASYKELKAKAEGLMRQAEAARKAETAAVVADIRKKMAEYGISVADLGVKSKAGRPTKAAAAAKVKPAKARKPVAAKYRNAESNESWSGRGRLPRWLAALEAAGRKREEFAVG